MTLKELSETYMETAALVRVAYEDARAQAGKGPPEERARAKEDCRMLRQMLLEARALRRVTRDYYDRPRDPEYTMTQIMVVNVHDG